MNYTSIFWRIIAVLLIVIGLFGLPYGLLISFLGVSIYYTDYKKNEK